VVAVAAIGERHQQTGIGDAFHDVENPLRDDKSLGPRTVPASRMNGFADRPALAFSSWSRMICPCD
jgi:hypothetical protein